MRDKPYAVVNLLDDTQPTLWYATYTEAMVAHIGEPIDIQYRPGRKKKVTKK